MIDTVAEHGWLASALMIMNLLQMLIQARWIDEFAITTLPHVNSEHIQLFSALSSCLPKLCFIMRNKYSTLVEVLGKDFQEEQIFQVSKYIKLLTYNIEGRY